MEAAPERGLPPRSEVPVEATADVASLFPAPQDWEAAARRAAGALEGLAAFRGRLGASASVLADWLDASGQARRDVAILGVYAELRHCADTADPEAAGREDRARALGARTAAACAFAEPEIAALGRDRLEAWCGAEPRLAPYRHHFDRVLRHSEHLRSAEVEELFGSLEEPFGSAAAVHGILADADLAFRAARGSGERVAEVSHATIDALLQDADPEMRRSAWEAYADAFIAHRHAMAACMATGVKQRVFLARARGYGSALEAALSGNDIPVAVFHQLLEVFRARLPVWHRYWRLLRRTVGGGRLRVCDIKAPLSRRPPVLPFGEAVEMIAAGMAPLGAEYVETLRRGAGPARWVDWAGNRGKRAGAFSTGSQGTPPFILMSYTNDMASLSTLAHELGHSLHSWYAQHAQPFVYSDYSIFVAEVASNFNQALVRSHLLATHGDREFRLAVLEEAMANFHRYLFLMPTLARFELAMHERAERGEALTADVLDAMLGDLFAEGYGGEVEMDRARAGVTWAQFPSHLYADFYVYQYATGIAGAQALAARVLAGGPPGPTAMAAGRAGTAAAEAYLDFLRAGGSVYPLDALRRAGVDLTRPEPIEAGFAALEETVAQIEALVGAGGGS